jgi:hypothetical protein
MEQNRNPYVKDGEGPQLKNSVVVFMDILGYREMAENAASAGTEPELLLRLHSTLESGQKFLKGDLALPKLGLKDFYAVKAFTDNIVIGWPIRTDAESELGSAFFKVSFFQFNLALEGFFIRGGLSIGPLYMDDIAVFGRGLNEAYDAESRLARDPRIVLASSAEEAVKTHMRYYAGPDYSPQSRDLYRDSDGKVFLNYLDSILIAEDENGPYYDELLKHKEVVERALSEHKGNPMIWSKYAWAANYHNYFCEQHPNYFNVEHMIEQSKIRMVPRRITEA